MPKSKRSRLCKSCSVVNLLPGCELYHQSIDTLTKAKRKGMDGKSALVSAVGPDPLLSWLRTEVRTVLINRTLVVANR